MKTTTKLWGDFYERLDQIDPKCPLENKVIKQTMRPKRYAEHARMLVEKLKDGDSILEIGCGYGGLAQEILKRISVSYTVVDNKSMLVQARKFLHEKVEYVEAKKIKTLHDRKFTLFVSFHCLSETPPEYRKYVLKNIIKNCQKISIKDLNDPVKPTPKMLESGYEMLPLRIEKWIDRYFIIEKTEHRHDQVMYVGERKK